jgi:hypothetical protein
VSANSATTILLPEDCVDGSRITVKAEMGAPLGNRKVTVKASANSKIDNNNTYVLKTPYSFVTIIYRDGNWYTIG